MADRWWLWGGLTAIFIASKYEDNRHITIDQLIQNACRGKFKAEHILKMEWEILLALGFNTSMPTHLEWLDAMLNDSFEDTNGEFFHRIRYWAIYMLKTAMYFPSMVVCPMQMLSLACIIYSIHSNFDSETVRMIKQKDSNLNLVVLEKHTLVASLTQRNCRNSGEQTYLSDLLGSVRANFDLFERLYPSLKNLEKYFTKERYLSDVEILKKRFGGLPH